MCHRLSSYTIFWYLLGWETLERACILHLAYRVDWLFCCLRFRFIKIYLDRYVLLCVVQKFICVALSSLNLFLLKTVAYVSAMCSYRWLASRMWSWTLRVGRTPMPSTPATFLVCCGRCSGRLTTLSPHSTQDTSLACWALSAVRW